MQHGVILAGEPRGVPLTFPMLPQFLGALNYSCHGVGKWHLGSHRNEFTPTSRGFQSYAGVLGREGGLL